LRVAREQVNSKGKWKKQGNRGTAREQGNSKGRRKQQGKRGTANEQGNSKGTEKQQGSRKGTGEQQCFESVCKICVDRIANTVARNRMKTAVVWLL
jgi:hypothetical protein